jgi:hypothetical protein
MASQRPVQDVGAALSRPWKRHYVGRPRGERGGRWPVGGGPISRLSCLAFHGCSWLSSSHLKLVGRGMVVVVGGRLGRAGGGGAPPDAA